MNNKIFTVSLRLNENQLIKLERLVELENANRCLYYATKSSVLTNLILEEYDKKFPGKCNTSGS